MTNKNISFLNGSRSWWTHVDSADKATHFTHNLFTSGDYSGSAVEATNRKVLLEDTKLCERLGIEELSESYSTDTVLFPIAALKDKEIIELFANLESYPLIDESALYEVEHDLEVECFDSFGRREFKEFLRSNDLLTDEQYDDIDDGKLDAIYHESAQHTNYNIFQVESGTSGYFDFDSFGGLHKKSIEVIKPIIHGVLK